jgi:hypothetical protein
MMKDEEVGMCWISLKDPAVQETEERQRAAKIMGNLIRKLVEERARSFCGSDPQSGDIMLALMDFGIDPTTWPQ